MKARRKAMSKGLTRREALKLSGLAMGGLAIGAGAGARKARAECTPTEPCYPTDPDKTQRYTYFEELDPMTPWGFNARGEMTGTPLEPNEMRISFMGSIIPMPRRAQQEMSVLFEVGWNAQKRCPVDQFIFECGSGVNANYQAMKVGFGRMDKVFLNHLHGDP